jgi:hypothetical protein
MTAATWIVAGVVGGWVGCCAGYFLGHGLGYRKATREWRRLFVELGEDHGNELHRVEDELAKADRTIADLNHNIGIIQDAAFYQGQLLQADREEHGL